MIARALTGIGKECLTTIFLGIETRLLRNRISLLMTTLRFKWSIQYNHKILSPSGCVVWVIFQSSSDRSSSPIARSASTVALRLGLGDSVPSDFSYTPCSVMSMSKGGFGPAAWVELVRLAARDRTDAAIAKPETSVCSRRRTLAAKFPGTPRLLDKTGFEREIGFGGFEHLAAPSSPSRQRRKPSVPRRFHGLDVKVPRPGCRR